MVHKKGYGLADLVTTSPSAFDRVPGRFALEAIHGHGDLLLAQDGKLSLDDEVKKHIAEFPDFGERVTIRHLLPPHQRRARSAAAPCAHRVALHAGPHHRRGRSRARGSAEGV